MVVKINNTSYTLDVKDKYDDLLHSLGLDNLATKKVNDVKAPMPGMVLNILVTEGQEVKKGDALIVLEAMKTVSYTHLDVYKRQGFTSSSEKVSSSMILIPETVDDFLL